MKKIVIGIKDAKSLIISNRKIDKTEIKTLEYFLDKSWRLVNINFKNKKNSIEYELFLLGITDKYLRKENYLKAKEKAAKKNIILDENKIEIKIKDEIKEFYEVKEADLERINKYIDWMKDEMLAGLKFNRETGLTLEKVNSFLKLSETEKTIKEKIDEEFNKLGFIK